MEQKTQGTKDTENKDTGNKRHRTKDTGNISTFNKRHISQKAQ